MAAQPVEARTIRSAAARNQPWPDRAAARLYYLDNLHVVLLVQYALLSIDLAPFAKFVLATLASVPLTFLFSYWVRKPLHM